MKETKSVKALKKQLGAAIAMVCVAAIALGSSTYAWFVSNNSVKATTSQISAQSNSAYLVIDNSGTTETPKTATSNTSTSAATASEVFTDTALYPAQWAKNYDANKTTEGNKVYQFETAYAKEKGAADEKDDTRFAIGNPAAAVKADYALLNTFYVGTGKYDGEFTKLKVSDMTVTASADASLKTAMRLLIMTYAPTGTDGKYATEATDWAVVKYDGSKMAIESQSNTESGVIYDPQFGKTEGDVKVEVYAYYDGADKQVYTTNLEQLTGCGATVTFDATPNEFKAK